ncbi:hypothetical protein [Streptomyces sp. NPDC059466]|uniref:hypothetical protein n=1 Tax=unclassified Streptomyces TaxID=2593676 RepID=UPI0036B0E845
MKRNLTAAVALLLATLTACGSGADKTQKPADNAAPRSAARTAKSATRASTPTPSSSRCGPSRDVLVWYKVPDIPDSAQTLGNYNVVTCETTFDDLQHTSPTQPGYCTAAAWVSDNPGYDVDARPAMRPKKVQVAVGPGC